MNWGEFKKAVEESGVKDDDQIEISVEYASDGPEDVTTELIHPKPNGDFDAIFIFTI